VKVETIARNTGLTERTVLRALDELEEQRFIFRKASQTLDTIYFLDPDSPRQSFADQPRQLGLVVRTGPQ